MNPGEATLRLTTSELLDKFVAISLSGLHTRLYTGEEWETTNYIDGNGELLETLHAVNVLLVERDGDIAYRRELGWMYLKDWGKAN